MDRILQNNNLTGVIPSAWTSNNTFPALISLDLSDNSFSGELSKACKLVLYDDVICWPLVEQHAHDAPARSQKRTGCPFVICAGTLPAPVATSTLSELRLSRNLFSGRLPDSWGAPGAFLSLTSIYLASNRLSGSLPAAWGGHERLSKLQSLSLNGNALEGTIPGSWVSAGAFAAFTEAANTKPFPAQFNDGKGVSRGVM